MRHQNLNAFLHEDVHHGVYVFTSDSCELCSKFEKDLARYDTSSFTFVEVCKDEEIIMENIFSVSSYPLTIVFVENQIGMTKKGMLFQKQMNDIFDFLEKNNIKSKMPKVPVTQLTPVILEIPTGSEERWSHEYFANVLNDCIKRDEAPLNLDKLFDGILDRANVIHKSILDKMQESWSTIAQKTVVYTDLGITEYMLEGITDATAKGKEVEFRKLYEH